MIFYGAASYLKYFKLWRLLLEDNKMIGSKEAKTLEPVVVRAPA